MAIFVPNSQWQYTIYDVKEYINTPVVNGGGGGNNQFTGVLKPTITGSRTSCYYTETSTPVKSFTWYHLAPMIGFEISVSDSTISITSIPEYGYSTTYPDIAYNGYPYENGWTPKIVFYYQNSSGNYIEIGSFSNLSDYSGKTISKDVPGIDQALISVYCEAPDCGLHDNPQNPLAYVQLHTHVEKPSKPVITATTGKTITVSLDADQIHCTSDNTWHNSGDSYVYRNLKQGTNYTFKCRNICDGYTANDKDHVFESSTVTGKTWNITGQVLGSAINTMTVKATHTAGTGGNASERKIVYRLYKEKDTSSERVKDPSGNPIEVRADSGSPVTFSDLDTDTTYYCYAYTLGITDNNCWIESELKKPDVSASGNGNSSDVSAKTLRATVSWDASGYDSSTCFIMCNGIEKSIFSSGTYVGFTGLHPNTTYSIVWLIRSYYSYEYTYTIIDDKGEEVERSETRTDMVETTGSYSLTTKQAAFVSINRSTKTIQVSSESVNTNGEIMQMRVQSFDNDNTSRDWVDADENKLVAFTNLEHNKLHFVNCRIAGCYEFDSSGNETDVNDSEISELYSTLKLSFSCTNVVEFQHKIITQWQAYTSDGDNGTLIATNRDAVDNILFSFYDMDTEAVKNNPPYQSAEVIEGSNGNTWGTYKDDSRTVYSEDLTWYYCEYLIKVAVTDGFNVVYGFVRAHTLFPAAWIYSNGSWNRYMGHVYTDGKWVPAPAFIYSDNEYKEPNGD